MADVRALLRAEQSSRRITHPHLAYTKSGLLTCVICQLNIRSESLWIGHLKSANHKKNLKAGQDAAAGSTGPKPDLETNFKKRKIEDVEREDNDEGYEKKTKTGEVPPQEHSLATSNEAPAVKLHALTPTTAQPTPVSPEVPKDTPVEAPAIDEDEWAAFEREVVPMAHIKSATADYSAATIAAAPMSAAEIAAQQAETQQQPSDRRSKREIEAEEEKEEEELRMHEEFEVMEEMEEKVKKLRQRREALRAAEAAAVVPPGPNGSGLADSTNQHASTGIVVPVMPAADPDQGKADGDHEDEDNDSDEVDDWFS